MLRRTAKPSHHGQPLSSNVRPSLGTDSGVPRLLIRACSCVATLRQRCRA